MIKVYNGSEKEFTHNGLATVTTYRAELYEEENADYYAKLEFSINDKDYIIQDNIISLPDSKGEYDWFRIKNPETKNGRIYVDKALHISYDLEDVYIEKLEAYGNVQTILNKLSEFADEDNQWFVLASNSDTIITLNIEKMFLPEALQNLCKMANLRLLRKRNVIELRDNTAIEKGKEIRYKQNLTTLTKKENWNDVCTKVYPFGYNDTPYSQKFIALPEEEYKLLGYTKNYVKEKSFTPDKARSDYIKQLYKQYTDYHKLHQDEIEKYKDFKKQLNSKAKEVDRLQAKIEKIETKYENSTDETKKAIYEAKLEELNEDLLVAQDEKASLTTQKQDSNTLRKQYKETANKYLSDYKSYVDDTLYAQAKEYLAENCTPTVSYSIGVYDEDKRSYSIGENCKVFYPPLGMKETYAVTGYTYNVFTKEFTNLTFGDKKKRGKSAFEKFMPVNTEGNSIWNIWKDYLENTMNYQDEEEEKVVVQLALTGKEFNAAIKSLVYGRTITYDTNDSITTGIEVTNVAPGEGVATRELADTESGQVVTAYMDGTVVKLYTKADIIMLPEDSSYMFKGFILLTNLDLSKFDARNVKNMNSMFIYCRALTNIDLTSFDTSNVTHMNSMFSNCYALTNIDLSKFDTSNVTSMGDMFAFCRALTSIDLTSFNTSNVTNMMYMFDGCSALTNIDLSKFNTSNVTDMYGMFDGCKSLTSLNLSKFDTSNVTTMKSMFDGCSALTNIDLTSFDTSNVTNMGNMFDGCSALTNVDLTSFDTSNVIYMFNMFDDCSALTNVDLTSFNTSNVTNMSSMFYNCKSLTSILVTLGKWITPSDSGFMFTNCGCSNVTYI
ncbi:MAG: BspA family leucine-rich repeat surface protein [Lachnospiraceae bacterium]|nr:BspA family leucine-rich repeat surface protein [Lachnospiraceae bacterium]